jgi:alpha-galactosidase
MLEIGNGGQTITEYRTHFSLWCMLAAPLMAGNDLRSMDDDIRELLTNKEVIAVNQDTLGFQGFRFIDFGDLEVWVKALSGSDAAFCFLNRSNQPVDLNFNWKKMGIYHFSVDQNGFNPWKNNYRVKDLWKHAEIGTTNENLVTKLAGHEALLVRLSSMSE